MRRAAGCSLLWHQRSTASAFPPPILNPHRDEIDPRNPLLASISRFAERLIVAVHGGGAGVAHAARARPRWSGSMLVEGQPFRIDLW
jgi:hypothetical protein